MIIEVKITVSGGSGGDGIVSFRHEKYISRGGPDGGDGGSGGSVFLKAGSKVSNLGLLKQRKKFVAENGGRGGSCCKHGRKGKDLIIPVPVGTTVFVKANAEEGFIADLTAEGREILVARGGRGGFGNAHFATAVNQAPEIASKGQPGEEQHLILRLKLLTDICIIGLPNSGKSTLLSALSKARPQIASYPFSTRELVLGVMQSDRGNFVVAEIPALVEGAHAGKGLGNEFLCHVERTKLIIYLLDGTSFTVYSDLDMLNKELLLYDSNLLCKPKIVAVNKVDLPEVQAHLPEIRQALSRLDLPVFYISAATSYGILELTTKAVEMLGEMNKVEEVVLPHTSLAVFRPKPRKVKQ